MTGFEPRSSGIGSDCAVNCPTTTAILYTFMTFVRIHHLIVITRHRYIYLLLRLTWTTGKFSLEVWSGRCLLWWLHPLRGDSSGQSYNASWNKLTGRRVVIGRGVERRQDHRRRSAAAVRRIVSGNGLRKPLTWGWWNLWTGGNDVTARRETTGSFSGWHPGNKTAKLFARKHDLMPNLGLPMQIWPRFISNYVMDTIVFSKS